MLTFTEELLLLLDNQDDVFLPAEKNTINAALAGAVLMDLAFTGRIDTDLDTLFVCDRKPVGISMLDSVLARIDARAKPADTQAWIKELAAAESPEIREQALANLGKRGLIKKNRIKLLWFGRSRTYSTINENEKQSVKQRIRDVLFSNDIPDPRDIALVCLVYACNLLADLFTKEELKNIRPRIKQLLVMDLIGREVTRAVVDIERSILKAKRARPVRLQKYLLSFSIVGGIVAMFTLLAPRVQIPDQFGPFLFELLWLDPIWQQWTGYLLLGFSAVGLLIAFISKKRWFARLGGSILGKIVHVGLAIGCVLILFAHTGFRLGANLNAALMFCYLATLISGAFAGILIGGGTRLRKMGFKPPKRIRLAVPKLHRFTLFPMPALLVIHILIVYLY